MRLARVFPRKTKASPTDDLVFFGPPGLFPPKVDEVHISITFTWDMEQGEFLAREWEGIAPIKIGGPGTGMRGEEFEPGKYLAPGYIITSRGCPNKCWFCTVPKRDGDIRELPIADGWNVLDDNLLACSKDHIEKVFRMLSEQKHPVEFTGGLEAARLQDWHVELLAALHPKQMFFAYDTKDDLEPLIEAGKKLVRAGIPIHPHSHCLRCYVLMGWEGDTIGKAEKRLEQTMGAGFTTMAMLYRQKTGFVNLSWRRFQRQWARPTAIYAKERK